MTTGEWLLNAEPDTPSWCPARGDAEEGGRPPSTEPEGAVPREVGARDDITCKEHSAEHSAEHVCM